MGTRGRYSVAIGLSLATGIAGVTGFWTVVSRLASAYRLSGGERFVSLMAEHPGFGVQTAPKTETFRAWKENLRSFERLEACSLTEVVIRTEEGARVLRGARVGAGFFDLMGLNPIAGRRFHTDDETAANGVAMISRGFLQATFGDAEKALGRPLTLDGNSVTVVGVLPPNFSDSISPGEHLDVAMPIDKSRDDMVQVVGRLREGVSRLQAQRELDAWASVQPHAAAEQEPRWIILSRSEVIESRTVRMFRVSVVGGLILLLVTCSNVAHLVAAQDENLRKESATRWALGATPWLLLRWKWKRASIQTLCAGAGAVALAPWGLNAVTVTLPEHLRFLADMRMSINVFLVSLGLSLLFMLSLALPSLFRSPTRLIRDLAADNRFATRSALGRAFSHLYIVTLVACSFVLGVAACLVIGTVFNLGKVNLGFQVEGLQVVSVKIPEWKYAQQAHRAAFFDLATERLASVLERSAFAISSHTPPQAGIYVGQLVFGKQPQGGRPPTSIGVASVGSGYFRCLRQPVVAGREFLAEEVRAGAPAVVISETTAKVFGVVPDAALGQQIQFGNQWREVVGVVADVRTPGIVDSLKGFQVYFPLNRYRSSMSVVVRAEDTMGRPLRALISGLDSDVVAEVAPMKTVLAKSLAGVRFLTTLFSLMAALAGAMAIFGVYAVFSSFAITQRGTIAVRMVAGATGNDVKRWVLWKGLSRSLMGLAVGLLLSYPFCRLLSDQLFGVEPDSTAARVVAAAIVLAATTLATWLPAARASRIAPYEILREA